ncbi:ankyrin repeat domain-containing protein [Burkholderia vietnamiensis]|uniref:Uncharacterized protein n=1 Tax=Burkholderia vietnamiensis (strain G4 / LMG 22486) TaxID=269482 RepID=A4JFM3_BURVG|nr:hypothetical protein Bcep1808_2074 [Burkholderia vietnamiensis G4]MCB4344837.1 ankyrin repeat domain-containing protein [Burkholderia vietnamiensis]
MKASAAVKQRVRERQARLVRRIERDHERWLLEEGHGTRRQYAPPWARTADRLEQEAERGEWRGALAKLTQGSRRGKRWTGLLAYLLYRAAESGRREYVEALMPYCNRRTHQAFFPGETVLTVAARCGAVEGLRVMLPRVDAKAFNHANHNASMIAAQRGHLDCVRALLPHSDADAREFVGVVEDMDRDEDVDEFGLPAVLFAAQNGRLDCFEALLSASDPDTRDPAYGRTILMLAAQRGFAEWLPALLVAGDPAARDRSGRTALMIAACASQAACVKALLPVSDAKILDRAGRNALMLAAGHGHSACVDLLLPASDLEAVDEAGESALLLAARFGELACVERLLPVSDVGRRNGEGRTAADLAIEHAALWDAPSWRCADLVLSDSRIDPSERLEALASFGPERLPRVASMIEADALREAAGLSRDSANHQEPRLGLRRAARL